jgi:hypothetical protein
MRNGVYRGVYQWSDWKRADGYVRALWWVLAVVSVRGSIRYVVIPGLRRDDMLADPAILEGIAANQERAWWRIIAVESPKGGSGVGSLLRTSGLETPPVATAWVSLVREGNDVQAKGFAV